MMKIELEANRSFAFPMGVTPTRGGFHVRVASTGPVSMLLYRRNEREEYACIDFLPESRLGEVWSLRVGAEEGAFPRDTEYNFKNANGLFCDPYGKAFSGRDTWGRSEQIGQIRRSPLYIEEFDWGEDKSPMLRWSDSIVYRLHVRGFTNSPSSKAIHRGSFAGLSEKIGYLKELGVTTLDIMPCQEFEELMPRAGCEGLGAEGGAEAKINYWGYAKTLHFAPKASFCKKRERNPVHECKTMVKLLHEAGIEVIAEFFFDRREHTSYLLDLIRYWVYEYHIDGVRITGSADVEALAEDPLLSDIKLIYEYWGERAGEGRKRLGICSDAFQNDMRRFLKGDEAQLGRVIENTGKNPPHAAMINYIADIKGFSLMDLLSYDQKHNEANGENNRDGTDCNYSWNCGEEGESRKRKVLALRRKQLKNASLLVFLSRGTPLIASGDELGQSRRGNNNPYCQDNAISWLDWKLLKRNRKIFEWFRFLIAFRKAHPVFRAEEGGGFDRFGCGLPEVSYHGTKAWQPELEPCKRQIGILYSGGYAKKEGQPEGGSFYVIYNMHWEAHEFALPRTAKNAAWHLCIDTGREEESSYFREGEEKVLPDQRSYRAQERSIIVLREKVRDECI